MNRLKTKITKFFFCLLLLGLGTNVKAQFLNDFKLGQGLRKADNTDDTKAIVHQTVEIFPLAFVGNAIMLSYETIATQSISFKINGAFGVAEKSTYYNLNNYQSLYIEPQLRFYANGADKTLNGTYLGVFAYYKSLTGDFATIDFYKNTTTLTAQNGSAMAYGMIVGNKFVIGDHYIIDLYVGSGIQHTVGGYSSLSSDGTVIDAYKNRIIFQPGLSFGYGF